MAKGLLLGAGFSYDSGMPLAVEFSDTLFSYFDLQRMTNLIDDIRDRRPYGNDIPLCNKTLDKILETVEAFYQSDKSNYEKLFADIENLPLGNANSQHTVQYYLSVLRSIINELFLIYQLETYSYYLLNKDKYKWLLSEFADDELWVLTLNHDILIEMLCIDYCIPLREGYTDTVKIPTSNCDMQTGIEFGKVSATEKDINNLHYFNASKGINILKIHGGLNEYFQGDEKSGRKRLLFDSDKFKSSREYLSKIERFLHTPHYYMNGKAVHIGSEICFSDMDGKMQFMQPSILTGSKKYHQTLSSYPKEEKMALLSSALEKVDELYIIGYSFGDKHINNRIVHAMHLNDKMKVVIVGPSGKKQELFEPFDYAYRVQYCATSFSVWADYEKTGQWDSAFSTHMEKMTTSLRIPLIKTIKESIMRDA